MTRADLLTYLTGQFGQLESETGQASADTIGGYKLPIDAALRRLGVSELNLATATVADSKAEAALALVEYHALRRFRFLVSTRIDYPATQMMNSRSQIFRQIDDLLKETEERCSTLGYPVADANDYGMLHLNLDILEPLPPGALGLLYD